MFSFDLQMRDDASMDKNDTVNGIESLGFFRFSRNAGTTLTEH
jgi:hypothetical protein